MVEPKTKRCARMQRAKKNNYGVQKKISFVFDVYIPSSRHSGARKEVCERKKVEAAEFLFQVKNWFVRTVELHGGIVRVYNDV